MNRISAGQKCGDALKKRTYSITATKFGCQVGHTSQPGKLISGSEHPCLDFVQREMWDEARITDYLLQCAFDMLDPGNGRAVGAIGHTRRIGREAIVVDDRRHGVELALQQQVNLTLELRPTRDSASSYRAARTGGDHNGTCCQPPSFLPIRGENPVKQNSLGWTFEQHV